MKKYATEQPGLARLGLAILEVDVVIGGGEVADGAFGGEPGP